MKGCAVHFGDGRMGVAVQYYGRLKWTREIDLADPTDARVLARVFAVLSSAVDVSRFVHYSGRPTAVPLTLLRTACGLHGVEPTAVDAKSFRQRFSAGTWMSKEGWIQAARQHQHDVSGEFTTDSEATATALLEMACRDRLGAGLQTRGGPA